MEEDGPAAREHDLGPEELPRQHADPGPELPRIARHDPRARNSRERRPAESPGVLNPTLCKEREH